MPVSPHIADLLRKLPERPGVYQYFDAAGHIIYIGKAKVLKNRVKSYFQNTDQHSPKTKRLVEKIADLRWTETNSEVEALTLEANLVKEHQPRFNVLLRDDKHFLYFKVTTNEQYPRVLAVRSVQKDGAKYFGPKTDSRAVRRTISFLEKLFYEQVSRAAPETDHDKTIWRRKHLKLPCPHFATGMHPGPALETPEGQAAYDAWVQRTISFLAGNTADFTRQLQEDMKAAALKKQFELAAKLRDQLAAIESARETQLASYPDLASRDVVGCVVEGSRAYLALLSVRDGKLIDQKNMSLTAAEEELGALLAAWALQYYDMATDVPREILFPVEMDDTTALADWLSEKAGRRVQLLTPQRGTKYQLLGLAEKNAAAFAQQSKARFENASERTTGAAKELAEALGIEKKLRRIECYDISHLGGTGTSASMVVGLDGEPASSQYRHFSIRTLAKGEIDDYASLAETLRRRMGYLTPQLPEGVNIRRGTKKDISFMREHLVSRGRRLEDLVNLEYEDVFVMLDPAGVVCGYVREVVLGDRKIHAIKSLWVADAVRGRGYGQALLRRVLAHSQAKKIYLDCQNDMEGYYAQLGFRVSKQPVEELIDASLGSSYDDAGQLHTRDSFIATHVFMMREVKQAVDESFGATPDLVILDGGKGQLSAVLGATKFPQKTHVVALAKQYEEIWRAQPEQEEEEPQLPEGVKIKKATKKEMKEAIQLVQASPDVDHNVDQEGTWLVAVREKEVVGCCRIKYWEADVPELTSLLVRDDLQRQGVGSALVCAAMQACTADQLFLLTSVAARLCERYGFQIVKKAPQAMLDKKAYCDAQWPHSAGQRVIMQYKKPKTPKLHFEKVVLPKGSNALYLVTRLRDEAHRFSNELRKKTLAKDLKAS